MPTERPPANRGGTRESHVVGKRKKSEPRFVFIPDENASIGDLLLRAHLQPLTREEEGELAVKRDEAWHTLNSLNPSIAWKALSGSLNVTKTLPTLDSEERDALQAYNDCLNEFVEHNLRLIPFVIKKYGLETEDMPTPDLFQEAYFGLQTAARKFDHHEGTKFSTYAVRWIRQSIQRAKANTRRMIRLPVHAGDYIKMIDDAELRFVQRYGRSPTLDELTSESHLEREVVKEYIGYKYQVTYLDRPLQVDGDTTFGDLVASDKNTEEDGLKHVDTPDIIKEIRNLLDEREFIAFLGAYGPHPKSNRQLAKILGTRPENIHTYISRALAKLRHPTAVDLRIKFFGE